MLRLVSEVPVLEDTLLRILIMGLTREVPVNATDAIELVDQLITRAALQASDGKTCIKLINAMCLNFVLC